MVNSRLTNSEEVAVKNRVDVAKLRGSKQRSNAAFLSGHGECRKHLHRFGLDESRYYFK